MKGILNLENINRKNEYEVDLLAYNNKEVEVLAIYDDTYEIKTHDGSEYTIFKKELTQKKVD